MMRLYCEKVGIEFEDSMIHWEHPVKDMSVFHDFIPFHTDLLESSSFKPPSDVDKKVSEREDLELVYDLVYTSIKWYHMSLN